MRPLVKPTTTSRPSNAMHLRALVEDVAADRVVDDVGAVPAGDLLDDRDEVLGRVVDDVVGAELPADLGLAPRRRRWR